MSGRGAGPCSLAKKKKEKKKGTLQEATTWLPKPAQSSCWTGQARKCQSARHCFSPHSNAHCALVPSKGNQSVTSRKPPPARNDQRQPRSLHTSQERLWEAKATTLLTGCFQSQTQQTGLSLRNRSKPAGSVGLRSHPIPAMAGHPRSDRTRSVAHPPGHPPLCDLTQPPPVQTHRVGRSRS